jgi:ABC-type nitrate/sulfonate/bicarbonate transport system substrate-binding protein
VYGRNTNAGYPLDRVMIATIEQVVRYHIVAQPEITRMEQLKGKRLGVSSLSSASGFAALVVAQKMGWDPVRDIAIMANGAGMESLQERRVDAVIASEFRYAALAANGYRSIQSTDSWNVPTAGSGWVTTRTWLRENRETARRFVRSLVEGTAVVKRDKEKTLRAMKKWWGITDGKRLEELYEAALLLPSKPYPPMDGFRKAFELHPSAETQRYKAEDLYDDSFLRELDESGFIDSLYK